MPPSSIARTSRRRMSIFGLKIEGHKVNDCERVVVFQLSTFFFQLKFVPLHQLFGKSEASDNVKPVVISRMSVGKM
jgi:hypothetical protein